MFQLLQTGNACNPLCSFFFFFGSCCFFLIQKTIEKAQESISFKYQTFSNTCQIYILKEPLLTNSFFTTSYILEDSLQMTTCYTNE